MHKIHLESVDSTNTFAKQLAESLKPEDPGICLITADEQTAGRGRTGKSFSSRKGKGLYMSVLFPVGRLPEECLFITASSAVAVCDILRKHSGADIRIKWVNDLYLEDRKVCGILTEAVTDPATRLMKYCVLGIGVNLNAEETDFPEELRGKAGAVNGIRISKQSLAEEIAKEAVKLARKVLESREERENVLQRYRDLSMILGREVSWEESGKTVSGTAAGIDNEARLIVETQEGRKRLDSGYVSIRF